MKLIHGLVLLVAAVMVFSEDFPEEENVLVLGEDNFEKAIATFQHVLVEFCKFKKTAVIKLLRVTTEVPCASPCIWWPCCVEVVSSISCVASVNRIG